MDRLLQILSGVTLPSVYDYFAEGESSNPPFICYLFPGSDNFSVDGCVYYKINGANTEFYCDSRDPVSEATPEAVLDEHGIFYNKTEVWIESEKLHGALYASEMEVQSTWAIESSIT